MLHVDPSQRLSAAQVCNAQKITRTSVTSIICLLFSFEQALTLFAIVGFGHDSDGRVLNDNTGDYLQTQREDTCSKSTMNILKQRP